MISLHPILNILREIDRNILVYISTCLGSESLSIEDRNLLHSHGINIEEIGDEYPHYYKMFLLGRLTELIGDYNANQLDYADFDSYLKQRQYYPLTSFERIQYELARQVTYSHLKNLGNRMKTDMEGSIIEYISRSQYEKIVKKEIEEGVLQRKTIGGVISDLGHKTGDWKKDLGRIVDTEMNNIFQKGRAIQIMSLSGSKDVLVYKDVYEGACRHCIHLYLTKGIGSEPRVFKLSELIANGSNIGKKVEDWKATVPGVHPFCFTNPRTPIYTSKGYKYIKDIQIGDLVLTHKKRFRPVTSLVFTEKKVEGTYNIVCQLKNKNRKIYLRDITGDHPVLVNRNWIKASQIRVGHKLHLLHDKCSYDECNRDYPIYYIDEVDRAKVDHCSVSCKSFDKSQQRTVEERRLYTQNARRSCIEKYPNQSSPFHSSESKISANRSNGRRCSFIELKLRHFLDKLNIEYLVDFSIKRNELKKNGQKKLYFPDTYIPSLNIILEADGINWHEDVEADKKRDREIKELIDADVFRFTEDNIRTKGDQVFNEIQRIIKNHRGEYSFHEVEVVEVQYRERVQSENTKDCKYKLYNFSVDEDESYIANGFAVHNCRCNLHHLENSMKWDKDRKEFVDDEEKLRKEEERLGIRGTIKVTVGSKQFIV